MIQRNNVLVFNWLYDLSGGQPLQPPRFHQELAEKLSGADAQAADEAMRGHVRFGVEATVQAVCGAPSSAAAKWRLGRSLQGRNRRRSAEPVPALQKS